MSTWQFTITFDPPEAQKARNLKQALPGDDCRRLIHFMSETWDLSPEEIKNIATWTPTSITLHPDGLVFVAAILQWVCFNTIPRDITLTRNA